MAALDCSYLTLPMNPPTLMTADGLISVPDTVSSPPLNDEIVAVAV